MADFPDWTRLFQLAGTEITIPINIEASDVTLPVSIDAATVTLNIKVVDSSIQLPVSIQSSSVTMYVSIRSSVVTIDMNFTDQSVAVFDAAKWFAHEAAQISVWGYGNALDNSSVQVASRAVPANTTYFITGIGGGAWINTDCVVRVSLVIASSVVALLMGRAGANATFDTPMRATTGQTVYVLIDQLSGAERTCYGCQWGYDEVEEE